MKLPFPISDFPSPRAARRSERAVALVITLLLLAVITFMAVTFLVVSRNEHGNVATQTDLNIAKLAADTALVRAEMAIATPILATTNPFVITTVLVPTNFNNPVGFNPGSISPTNVNYDNTISGTPLALNDRLQNIANLLYDPRPPVFIVTNASFPQSNDFRFYLDINRNGRFEGSGLQPVISPDPAAPYYNINSGALMANPTPGLTLSNLTVGDPQWIGVLQRAQLAHSADNQFVSRYTYYVVPISQTLDVNAMHNDARFPVQNQMGTADGFIRNQGVMTAELNLAAFFADLNTNLWPSTTPSAYGFLPYGYDTNLNNANQGAAFADAQSLLFYRYNQKTTHLAKVQPLFGTPGVNAFQNPVDLYSQGPLMTGTSWPPPGIPNPNPGHINADPWQGSRNPNRFSGPGDFFDPTKTAANVPVGAYNFTKRLIMAGTNNDSYNAGTFSRLLSQLGTDSDSDPGGKMNLNYANVDRITGYVVPGMVTNFASWQPTNFFVNAAIRLLADAGYTVGNPNGATNVLVTNSVNTSIGGHNVTVVVTNLHIPIYPTNYYMPAVHRLLQLAANLYDSTTNRVDYAGSDPAFPLPTVFRPFFSDPGIRGGVRQVFIINYTEVGPTTGNDRDLLNITPNSVHDLSDPTDPIIRNPTSVFGIPLVVGAKKGLPNFNEFASHTDIQLTRKLQFRRPAGSTTLPVNQTNQMFLLGLSNVFGMEAWNSYTNNYTRPLKLVAMPDISLMMTNETANMLVSNRYQYLTNYVPLPVNNWSGFNTAFPRNSFQVPMVSNVVFLATSTYSKQNNNFVPLTGTYEQVSPPFYVPHWWLTVKTRLRFAVVDVGTSRVVDYVNLSDQGTQSITDDLTVGGQCGDPYTASGANGSMWCTNRLGGNPIDATQPTYGVMNQIETSLGLIQADWNSAVSEFPPGMDKNAAIDSFRNQYSLGPLFNFNTTFFTSNTFAAPYQPFRNIYLVNNWQANDPLVHYTVSDLQDLIRTNVLFDVLQPVPTANLGVINSRYEPWGWSRSSTTTPGVGKWEIGAKDPVASVSGSGTSDYWDFTTNKFPNPGWMGRVHRGTPWQTVYFKSPVITSPTTGLPVATTNLTLAVWQKWTGNGQLATNFGQFSPNLVPYNVPGTAQTGLYSDAYLTQPTNDWRLLDLFSTAFSDTATRGQLSVNQPGLAAWSAVLSGVVVLTNNPNPPLDANGNPILILDPLVIQPAGVYDPNNTNAWPPLVRIVNALNTARANNPGQVFTHLGDILAIPALTVGSPFINTTVQPVSGNSSLNDAAYERIPQQILGLLKIESAPRFVIYSWGQTLKPAPHSAYTGSGQFFGMITNYQIMAEVATRAVVRFEGAPAYPNGSAITNLHPVIESFSVLPPD